MMKTRTKVNGGTYDAVDAAMQMGMNRATATMAVPFMWFTPGGTDPYSPVVIMMIEALQHRLRHMGYENRADGFVDRATIRALTDISGPSWKSKAWIQVYGDVLHAAATGRVPTTTKEEIMSYTTMGRINGRVRPLLERSAGTRWGSLGAINETDWCSTSNPQGNCKPYANICKPMNATTLGYVKDLQRQLNRLRKKAGKKLLYVDGSLGPKTVQSVRDELPMVPHPLSCDDAMRQVDDLAVTARQAADMAGAPIVGDPAGSAARSPTIDPGTGQLKFPPPRPAGFTAIVDFVQSPIGMAAVAGGVLFFLWSRDEKKKKTKKRRTRKRTTRKRRRAKRRYTYTYY